EFRCDPCGPASGRILAALIVQHTQQQRLCSRQVALCRASLRYAGRRSEQIDERHQRRAVRQRLLRLVEMQPDLRAHQAPFTMMAVAVENLAEHLLGGCEFVFVLQKPRAVQLQCKIARVAGALHDLLGVAVVTLVAAARAGDDQLIDIANGCIEVVRSGEICSTQLCELRLAGRAAEPQYDLPRIVRPINADRSFGIHAEGCDREQRHGEIAPHGAHCKSALNAFGSSSASWVNVNPRSERGSPFSASPNASITVVVNDTNTPLTVTPTTCWTNSPSGSAARIVIVALPNTSGAGVICNVRFVPLPPSTIPAAGMIDGSDEVAVTVTTFAPESASPTWKVSTGVVVS